MKTATKYVPGNGLKKVTFFPETLVDEMLLESLLRVTKGSMEVIQVTSSKEPAMLFTLKER